MANQERRLILGVDGGGSSTRATVVDESGQTLATSFGGGVNPVDNNDWRANLNEAVAPLKAHFDRIAQACFALPAYGEADAVSDSQRRFASSLMPRTRTFVVNDVKAAHVGAFAAARPGVLLLAGTGSMSWAVDDRGSDIRIGGWGHMFSDEGSAYWIGREALALLAKIADRRTEGDGFLGEVSARLGLGAAPSMNAVLSWYTELVQPRSAVAALSMIVDDLVERGNTTAIALFDRAAGELADLVLAARNQLGANDVSWTYAGGLFRSRHIMRQLEQRLGAPVAPVLPPVGGSLLLAAQAAALAVSPAFVGKLRQTLPDAVFYAPTDSRQAPRGE